MQPTITRRTFLGASAAAAAGLAAGVGLTGCGGQPPLGGSGNLLRVATNHFLAEDGVDPASGLQVRGLSSIMSEFTQQHPDVKVEVTAITGSTPTATVAKIQTLLLGKQIDVLNGDTLWPYYNQGLIADISSYFAKDNWAGNYIGSIFSPPMERFMYPPWAAKPTIHLSAPGDLQSMSTAYDSQLFTDFGVEPLSAKPTIDELIEKLPRLTGKNPRTGQDCYGMFYDPRSTVHLILQFLAQGGLSFGYVDPQDPSKLTIDTPELKNGIEKLIDLSKYCPPGFEVGQGAENWGTEKNTVAVNLVVFTYSLQQAVQNDLVSRFVVTDGLRDRNGKTYLVQGTEWGMASGAANKDLSWELIKFLSGPAGQKLSFANTGSLPTWQNADWIDKAKQPYADPFLASAIDGHNSFYPQFMFSTLRPWIAGVVSDAVNGQKVDLDRGLADMQAKAEAWAKTQKETIGH